MSDNILEIRHLRTFFFSKNRVMRAVDDLSYAVERGQCVAIVGESGSGKSVSAMSIMRLIPNPPGRILGGEILFNGVNLLALSEDEMRKIRGNKISVIFQEPQSSLNPLMKVGRQITEAVLLHEKAKSREEAESVALEFLRLVGIPNPETRINDYPHQFSGGMQQRIMIAMAMCCQPELLIADEPTTALDVTVQAQVLTEIDKLRARFGTTVIIITHNLGIVARYADAVKVMYGGTLVEEGRTEQIFTNPCHPYTVGLIQSVPRLDLPKSNGLHTIPGSPPNMSEMPENCCPFHLRCPLATDRCRSERPERYEVEPGHTSACLNHSIAAQAKEAF